ncbi:MAG: hypothetical protein WDW38_002088 [Sanguina aurantia]
MSKDNHREQLRHKQLSVVGIAGCAKRLVILALDKDFTGRLTSVKANAKFSSSQAGPEQGVSSEGGDLRKVVASLKQRFGLQFVYCWHSVSGYWAGVMPDEARMDNVKSSIVFAKPSSSILEVSPETAWEAPALYGIGVPDDPALLYHNMHTYLASCGIDGVKVDCQSTLGLLPSCTADPRSQSERHHAALEASVATHFPGNHMINCMCHSTEDLYRMKDTAVARASEDFWPNDESSSRPHIAQNAYNSLFMAPLVLPDWDMFQSTDVSARLHAMARAVSGGPVYVSDKPGCHDVQLLRQLVLPDGSIYRAAGVGRPTLDCLFVDVLRDGVSLLKVWNVNAVTLVVGVFNLQGDCQGAAAVKQQDPAGDTLPPSHHNSVPA